MTKFVNHSYNKSIFNKPYYLEVNVSISGSSGSYMLTINDETAHDDIHRVIASLSKSFKTVIEVNDITNDDVHFVYSHRENGRDFLNILSKDENHYNDENIEDAVESFKILNDLYNIVAVNRRNLKQPKIDIPTVEEKKSLPWKGIGIGLVVTATVGGLAKIWLDRR